MLALLRLLWRCRRCSATAATARRGVATAPQLPPLRLLCRRGDLVVLDKPAGMLVHPPSAGEARFVPAEARYVVREAADLFGGATVHPVSRLDAPTSGVLAMALSPHTARALQAVWADDSVVTKGYIVLVARHPAADAWTEERPLTARELGGLRKEHTLRDRNSLAAAADGTAQIASDASAALLPQAARTDFTVIARFPPLPPVAPREDAAAGVGGAALTHADSTADDANGLPFGTALLSAVLHTGRWHQIRRHLAGAGHHVLGDARHGKLRWNGPARATLGLPRLFLHAASLRIDFSAPAALRAGLPPGPPLRCEAPLPPELLHAAQRLPGWPDAAAALRVRGLLPDDVQAALQSGGE